MKSPSHHEYLHLYNLKVSGKNIYMARDMAIYGNICMAMFRCHKRKWGHWKGHIGWICRCFPLNIVLIWEWKSSLQLFSFFLDFIEIGATGRLHCNALFAFGTMFRYCNLSSRLESLSVFRGSFGRLWDHSGFPREHVITRPATTICFELQAHCEQPH